VRGLVGERRDKLTTALILLVLAAVTTTAVLQWRQADHLTQQNRTQQQVRTRAAEFGQALLAYKHTDLTNARTRIQQLTATDFGKSYEAAFDGLADTITKYKADATATVRDTYINQIDGDRAKALVILDSEVRSTAGTRRVIGTKLLLELIREKGQWRVSGLATLQADDETMTKPDGTPTTPKDTSGDPSAPSPQPDKTP
jgi:Mce-associated membrane protein